MAIRNPVFWMGVAALAAAFFIPMLMQHEEEIVPTVAAEPNFFPFVRSLDGTTPDGNIKTASNDVLVVDAELGRLFDYYLATVGEQPLDAIRAEIENELDRRLKPRAAREAKHLLARYLDYKRALADVEKNAQLAGGSVDAVRGRLTAMQQVRARFFSAAESQGLFGFDDAYDMDAVTRLEIGQDHSLSDAQKQERLAALDAALPPAVREARDAPLKIIKQEEAVAKMRAEGASEDDIYRMRAANLSPEAAARFAEVDQEETTWKSRITSYLAERNKLMGNTANSPEPDRQAALQQLRQTRFNADEERRLAAYE
jgi:lipase chaperone LimK